MGSLSDTSSRYHLVLAVKKVVAFHVRNADVVYVNGCESHAVTHFFNTQPHAPFDVGFDNYAFSVRGCCITGSKRRRGLCQWMRVTRGFVQIPNADVVYDNGCESHAVTLCF